MSDPNEADPAARPDLPAAEPPLAEAAGVEEPPPSSGFEAPAMSTPEPVASVPSTYLDGNGPPPPPPPVPLWPTLKERVRDYVRDYAAARVDFLHLLLPLVLLSVLLYTRLPTTNYIFDEQEALLANPYVNKAQGLRFIDAIHRDFWGLAPDRSVGSYRPIPDMMWRLLWMISKQPFFHHFYNVLFHAVNAALLGIFALRLTKRRDVAWLTGAIFVGCAVLTEAVSGIVGIADVLGGMGAILALYALSAPMYAMPAAVFASVLFGLFCKESALVCVPLIPVAALVAAPLTHPERPLRFVRGLLALVAAAAAFVLYVELRRRWFPSPLPHELEVDLPADATPPQIFFRKLLVWFHQAPLPKDPLNNPLVNADRDHRIAGALRVYWRGLTQLVFPKTLSGDYSYPQEDVPETLVFRESVLGAGMMVLPLLGGLGLWILAMAREHRARREARALGQRGLGVEPPLGVAGAALVAVGLVWIVVSYFPHSNIPIVLPTVRAERFLYFPAIGSTLVLAVLFAWLDKAMRARALPWLCPSFFGAFFAFQCVAAYRHAMDYRDDVTFWEATKKAVPNSAKAHLNFSVMKGARGDLPLRLEESKIALALAPKWPMAHVYTGDTLCRLHRAVEAWPYYKEGFTIGPNELSLIALGLQCMHDEGDLKNHEDELRSLAYEERMKGTWIAYLAIDTLDNAEKNKGVDPKYRPRGYNEGPKDNTSE